MEKPDRILRLSQVAAQVGISKTSIYQLVKRGEFPAQIRLTSRTVGWRESEVVGWLASRPGPDIEAGRAKGKRLQAARKKRSPNPEREAESRAAVPPLRSSVISE